MSQSYLQGFGDASLGGVVDLRLPHPAAARFTQLPQAEAQILLIRVVLDLRHTAVLVNRGLEYSRLFNNKKKDLCVCVCARAHCTSANVIRFACFRISVSPNRSFILRYLEINCV